MKTALKVISIIFASILIITMGILIYFLSVTKDAKLDKTKLINMEKTISFYDESDNLIFKTGDEKTVTVLSDIPLHVQRAFIAIEDKRFYNHNGVDYKGLSRAMLSNIKSFSFKEGGSTISQQLIKNTHLSNKKTFKRKLSEIKLARELEKKYTKSEILEKYLNTIYFGDNCYGITKASNHYFGKSPAELSVNEGAALAGIIKAPSNYSPYKDIGKCNSRKDLVLNQMYKQNYIDKNTYEQNYKTKINVKEREDVDLSFDFTYYVQNELNNIVENNPYGAGNLKVYTTYNDYLQKNIEKEIIENDVESDKSALILSKSGEIKAYYSTCGEIKRQLGSTIKPLLVYAPAIENDVVYSCSPILDEKTDFNGYSPSNYNDKYYGYISVKESLAKSLNSCAVKILNYTGIEKSKNYLQKTDIKLLESDNSLCLALGATEQGAKLSEICSAYNIFLNQGDYIKPYSILRVESQNNGVLFNRNINKTNVFSKETTHIINDMLEYTVTNGTAKKLSFTNIPLCSKTGTVGTENGNFDAYNISYNSEYVMGVWFGNKDNSLMNNSITGGSAPSIISSQIWKEIYKGNPPPQSYIHCDGVCKKDIDKMEYDNNNCVMLANEYIPKRYVMSSLFKKNHLPSISNNFQNPQIKNAQIEFVDNYVKVTLELDEFYNAIIYRKDKKGKIEIYDTLDKQKNREVFLDKSILPNTEYEYSIIPYIKTTNSQINGKEIFLKKIKTPNTDIDEWWEDDLT